MNVLIVCTDGEFLSPLMANYVSFFNKTKAKIYFTNTLQSKAINELELNNFFADKTEYGNYITLNEIKNTNFYLALSLTTDAEAFVVDKINSTYFFNYNFYLNKNNYASVAQDMKLYAQRFCRVHLNEFM